jgi:thiosulfate/3-mercaptopyruvate sulfurtransferase
MAPVLTSPLVSTQWLADHLGADDLVVLDASVRTDGTGSDMHWRNAVDDHEQVGHVPGAGYADLLEAFSATDTDLPLTRPSAEQFERAVRDLGVSSSSTVVVYDDAFGQWSSRLWWLFRSFGFDAVAVLDGGFAKWQDEDRPVRIGGHRRRRAARAEDRLFLAGEERDLWADRDRVERAVEGVEPAALVFAADEADLGADHLPIVPGTTTIPVRDVLDADTRAFRKPKALKSVLAPVLGADEIVTYCGIGSAACVDALALTVAGHRRVRVYDGSLADWWRREPAA